MRTTWLTWGLLGIVLAIPAPADTGEVNAMEQVELHDRQQILAHIDSIFQAFLRQDRDAIRATHAEDWVGFLGPSTGIERGIDDYMAGAERSLENFQGTGYELLDTEVQLYGDFAVVFYIARYDYLDNDGKAGSLALRSVDLYVRVEGRWTQSGSHITPIPEAGAWGEGSGAEAALESGAASGPRPRAMVGDELAGLLADREAVWRAYFAGDREQLQEVLPEELIAINAGAEDWLDLSETLTASKEFSSSGSKLIRLEFPKTRVLAYDDVAILFTTYLFEIESEGQRTTSTGRGTEVFVRRDDGRWLNSGWHLDSGR